jgi:hypothetical protein
MWFQTFEPKYLHQLQIPKSFHGNFFDVSSPNLWNRTSDSDRAHALGFTQPCPCLSFFNRIDVVNITLKGASKR